MLCNQIPSSKQATHSAWQHYALHSTAKLAASCQSRGARCIYPGAKNTKDSQSTSKSVWVHRPGLQAPFFFFAPQPRRISCLHLFSVSLTTTARGLISVGLSQLVRSHIARVTCWLSELPLQVLCIRKPRKYCAEWSVDSATQSRHISYLAHSTSAGLL